MGAAGPLAGDGFGASAWRHLRRVTEPGAYLRAGRDGVTIGRVVAAGWKPILVLPVSWGRAWALAGLIIPVRRVPHLVCYWRATPDAFSAEAKARPPRRAIEAAAPSRPAGGYTVEPCTSPGGATAWRVFLGAAPIGPPDADRALAGKRARALAASASLLRECSCGMPFRPRIAIQTRCDLCE